MNAMNLQHKRILVTGASSGIGRACAICAAGLGASVVMTGRRVDALRETLAMCAGTGHETVAGDIACPKFIGELAEAGGRHFLVTHNSRACLDVLAQAGLG